MSGVGAGGAGAVGSGGGGGVEAIVNSMAERAGELGGEIEDICMQLTGSGGDSDAGESTLPKLETLPINQTAGSFLNQKK